MISGAVPDRGARGLCILAAQGRLQDGEHISDIIDAYGPTVARAAQRGAAEANRTEVAEVATTTDPTGSDRRP